MMSKSLNVNVLLGSNETGNYDNIWLWWSNNSKNCNLLEEYSCGNLIIVRAKREWHPLPPELL